MPAPVNDLCANALPLPSSSGTLDTTSATDDPAYPDVPNGSGNSYNGIWYRVTMGPAQAEFHINGVGPDPTFELVLTLFEGTSCGSLVNTGQFGGAGSNAFTGLTPGQTYYILFTTYDSGGLAGWSFTSPGPSGDFCADLVCATVVTPPSILVNSNACCGVTPNGPPSAGPVEPPIDAAWIPSCAGGGLVPTVPELTLAELWDY